jgi:ubiquinone/menaquinone biosynthesis C-methylase UbiE
MELLGLKTARVMQMDAEEMTFANDSFDYIWTWGVIHHSADTKNSSANASRASTKRKS